MNIPDGVIERAGYLRESRRDAEADQVIAEWARKEALRDAADKMEAIFRQNKTLGMPTDNWLRALAEKAPA